MFFHGVAIKTAVSVSWHTTPVSLYQSNDLQFEIQNKKDAAILKMLLWISCFWFWSYAPSKFCCFDVHSVQSPQIFQVQVKTSTVLPMFLDYLSISYDYDWTHTNWVRSWWDTHVHIRKFTLQPKKRPSYIYIALKTLNQNLLNC